jgi:hypothetical protein
MPLGLQLPLGAKEGALAEAGLLGGLGEGVTGVDRKGELPEEQSQRVGAQPGMPDEVVRNLTEGTSRRDNMTEHSGGLISTEDEGPRRWLLPASWAA